MENDIKTPFLIKLGKRLNIQAESLSNFIIDQVVAKSSKFETLISIYIYIYRGSWECQKQNIDLIKDLIYGEKEK